MPFQPTIDAQGHHANPIQNVLDVDGHECYKEVESIYSDSSNRLSGAHSIHSPRSTFQEAFGAPSFALVGGSVNNAPVRTHCSSTNGTVQYELPASLGYQITGMPPNSVPNAKVNMMWVFLVLPMYHHMKAMILMTLCAGTASW